MNFEDLVSSLNEEQKRALINALNSKKEQPRKEEVFKNLKPTVGEDFTVNREVIERGGRNPVKARDNEWVDDGQFRDIETPSGKISPRNRPKPKKIEVECHVCGRTFHVNQQYVYGDFQRCNRCVGK